MIKIADATFTDAAGKGVSSMPCTDNGVPMNQILCGDNLKLIQQLPDCSIQLVITSPPYFQQRDYGSGMGNEENVNDYIETLLCLAISFSI